LIVLFASGDENMGTPKTTTSPLYLAMA